MYMKKKHSSNKRAHIFSNTLTSLDANVRYSTLYDISVVFSTSLWRGAKVINYEVVVMI